MEEGGCKVAEILSEGKYFRIKYGDRSYMPTLFTTQWQAEKALKDYEDKKRKRQQKRAKSKSKENNE